MLTIIFWKGYLNREADMGELARKADHRIMALDATNKLQEAMGFDDKWKGLVENAIYTVAEDCYRRGAQYASKPE